MTNENPSDFEALREEVCIGFTQLDAGQRVPAADVYSRIEAIIQAIEIADRLNRS